MKQLFKFSLLLFVLLWCVTLTAQKVYNTTADVAPNKGGGIQNQIEAIWDVLLEFDAATLSGGPGNAGAEWDGTYFYSTRWASNLIHKYDATGTTLIEQFSIPGVSGLRDLAYDGTYMYGGAAANTIYQMDFVTKTLIGTITSPVAVRFIAYDPGSDAFWVGNWADPPTLVSRSGVTLATITTGLTSQYGCAYDSYTTGNPTIWIFDQGGSGAMLYQYDIATGTATGVTHDVMTDIGLNNPGAIAGGLFAMCDFSIPLFTIGGLLQGGAGIDEMFVYDSGANCVPPCTSVEPPTNPDPVNGATGVSINLPSISWTNGVGTEQVEVFFGEAGNVQSVYLGSPITSWSIPGPLNYQTTYQWKVTCTNLTDPCSKTGPLWSFSTELPPGIVFIEPFNDMTCWTAIGPMGQGNWSISNTNNAGGTAPELMCFYSPSYVGLNQLLSCTISSTANHNHELRFKHMYDWYTDPCPVDGIAITYDGGATSTSLWEEAPVGGNVGPEEITVNFTPTSDDFQIIIYNNGNSFNFDYLYYDDIQITDLEAGTTGFFEDFDGFIAGQQVACQDPTNWTTWNLTPCDPVTDPYVSTNYAWTPSNSVVIVQNNDLVKPLGAQTSGKWYMSFVFYIPTGKAGYFNTLQEFFGTPQSWGMECYFDAGGVGRLLNGNTVNFSWTENTWHQVVVVVDLDLDQAEFLIGTGDPLTSVATWQWTRGGTMPLKLDANDFYGATANDEMYFDNYYFDSVEPPIWVPVELTSFSSSVNDGNVTLTWATATETNNQGFEVQRSEGTGFVSLGFIEGHGTTTEKQFYSFTDKDVQVGTYTYRLKQVDFDGTYEYFTTEVVVGAPKTFALEQNYPNPFNPTTKINFSLAADSKVTLKVFNVLGQEVATLINTNLVAGRHEINFDASGLNSGVYFYRIEATGNNGSNFVDIRKMVLTK